MPSNKIVTGAELQEKLAKAKQKLQELEKDLGDPLNNKQKLIEECHSIQSLIDEINSDILNSLMQI